MANKKYGGIDSYTDLFRSIKKAKVKDPVEKKRFRDIYIINVHLYGGDIDKISQKGDDKEFLTFYNRKGNNISKSDGLTTENIFAVSEDNIDEKVSKKLRSISEKETRKYINIGLWMIAITMIIIFLRSIPIIIEKWKVLEPLSWVFGLIFYIMSLLGSKMTFRKIRNYLEIKISKNIYKRKLAQIKELLEK